MTSMQDNDIRRALRNASLDAPQVDIWERVAGKAVPRRRFFDYTAIRWVAALLSIVAVGAVTAGIFSIAGDPNTAQDVPPTATVEVSVPDVLLLQSFDVEAQENQILAYSSDTETARRIVSDLRFPDRPTISRDGRQMVYLALGPFGDPTPLLIRMVDTETMTEQWSAEIATLPTTTEDGPTIGRQALFVGNKLIVAWYAFGDVGPLNLTSFDRYTGQLLETSAASLEVGSGVPLWALSVALMSGSDEGSFKVVARRLFSVEAGDGMPLDAVFTFDSDSLTETGRVAARTVQGDTVTYDPWTGIIAPDRTTYYSLARIGESGTLSVLFFDITQAREVAAVDAGFPAPINGLVSYQTTVSPDGRLLYIYEGFSGSIAVIDLQQRTLVESGKVAGLEPYADIDLTDTLGPVPTWAVAGLPGEGMVLQLAPDGKHLYAININRPHMVANGVLVIDTDSWNVVDRWLQDAYPTGLASSGDGRYVYAMTRIFAGDISQGGRMGPVRVIDTTTGAEIPASAALQSAEPVIGMDTLAALYQQQWGVAPPRPEPTPAPDVQNTPEPTPEPALTMPDVLLFQGWDDDAKTSRLSGYTHGEQSLHLAFKSKSSMQEVAIAKDGTQLVTGSWERDGNDWDLLLTSLDTRTLAQQWSSVATRVGGDERGERFGYVQMRIVGDRIFIVVMDRSSTHAFRLVAIDRHTGDPVGESAPAPIDPDNPNAAVVGVLLSSSSDDTQLYVMAAVLDGDPRMAAKIAAVSSFNVLTLEETRSAVEAREEPRFAALDLWSMSATPDGSAAWGLRPRMKDQPLMIDFISFSTGTLETRLSVDFDVASSGAPWLETALSADGQTLYVFDPSTGNVAIIDLQNREVLSTHNVDVSGVHEAQTSFFDRLGSWVRDLFVESAAAGLPPRMEIQISPDGNRLSAIAVDAPNYQTKGVLVIDTESWEIIDHWLPGEYVLKLVQSGDGQYLYTVSMRQTQLDATQTFRSGLRVIDTTTGQEVELANGVSDPIMVDGILTLAALYQQQWGVSPPISATR